MLENFYGYFGDITNYMDIVTLLCIGFYCYEFIDSADKVKKEIVYLPLYIGVLVGFWRCLNYIQVFGKNIRTNVIMF